MTDARSLARVVIRPQPWEMQALHRATAAFPLVFALGLAACGGQTVGGESEGSGTLSLEEATIRGIHDAFASGTLACVQLVEYYLRRVEAYDDQGPARLRRPPRAATGSPR